MSRIAVIGAGYVGLTSAACLAHLNHDVVCGDVDADHVEELRKGQLRILEAGLDELVEEGIAAGRLTFVVGAATAVGMIDAEFVFLCVPTPQGEDGAADLSIVETVAAEIAPILRRGAVIVNKSTMPVGSTQLVARALAQGGAVDVGVASNPEFLREGHAVEDFLHPSRVVIGCDDVAVSVRVSELYQPLGAPLVLTDPASAELVKYASNAYLATRVSFVNALANLSEAVDADVRDVVLGMGYDPRIGFEFLQPGPGYGGACLPKDTLALAHTAEQAGYDFSLLRGVIEVNDHQQDVVLDKIHRAAGGDSDVPALAVTVAVWGLTFKANTDDLRRSPAVAVVARLVAEGYAVRAYDPTVRGELAAADWPVDHFSGVHIADDPREAVAGAGVLVVMTEWDEFRWVDFTGVAGDMSAPRAVVDARNLLDPLALRRLGLAYQGIGR